MGEEIFDALAEIGFKSYADEMMVKDTEEVMRFDIFHPDNSKYIPQIHDTLMNFLTKFRGKGVTLSFYPSLTSSYLVEYINEVNGSGNPRHACVVIPKGVEDKEFDQFRISILDVYS